MASFELVFTPELATFLFVFAIIFGLLSYARDVKDEKKKFLGFGDRVNAIIALAVALFATASQTLVIALQQFMPLGAVFLIIVFMILFMKKLAGDDKNKDYFPAIATLGILLVILGALQNRLTAFIPAGIDPNTVLWVVGIVVVLMFFWLSYKYKGTPPATGGRV